MHVKTMEGLTGAHTNHNLLKTPFRVFKDARRRGDMAAMERAMGYMEDFEGKAKEYQAEAEEGMEEDAKEAAERVQRDREKLIEKCREDRLEQEERIQAAAKQPEEGTEGAKPEWGSPGPDKLEISKEGQMLSDNGMKQAPLKGAGNNSASEEKPSQPPELKSVVYTREGNSGSVVSMQGNINLSV